MINNTMPIIYDNISEGYYINKDGQIYSNKSNRFLVGSLDKDGYVRVSLRRDIEPKQKTYKVHRLVKIIFDPIKNFNNLTVDHLDGDKLNNNINNLDWCSSGENSRRGVLNK
jgi:hypothetical protein